MGKITIEELHPSVRDLLNNDSSEGGVNGSDIIDGTITLPKLSTDVKTKFSNIESEVESLKQSSNNCKDIIATAIGTPLTSNDTFVNMGSKIDTLTQTFKNNLAEKGIETDPDVKMSTLIDNITNVKIEKHNFLQCMDDDICITQLHSFNNEYGWNIIETDTHLIGFGYSDTGGTNRKNAVYKMDKFTGTDWIQVTGSSHLFNDLINYSMFSIGELIYIFGGYTSPYPTDSTVEYDYILNTRNRVISKFTSVQQGKPCIYNNTTVFLFGGLDSGGKPVNIQIDMITKTFANITPCPSTKINSAHCVDNIIYCIDYSDAKLYKYDINLDLWNYIILIDVKSGNLFNRTGNGTSFIKNNKIYLLGMHNSNGYIQKSIYSTDIYTGNVYINKPTILREYIKESEVHHKHGRCYIGDHNRNMLCFC